MHDEVKPPTCRHCFDNCAFIYGTAAAMSLEGYMERQHGKHHDCAIPSPAHLSPAKIQQFAALVRESFPDDQPIRLVSPARAVTVPSANVSTRCARCSHEFTSRTDGFVDEALENEISAHQERCFVVGDCVRWDHPTMPGNWIEGQLIVTRPSSAGIGPSAEIRIETSGDRVVRRIGSIADVGLDNAPLRHIPRPQQDEAAPTMRSYATHHCQGHAPDGSQCRETRDSSAPNPAPYWRCAAHASCTTYVGNADWCAFCTLGPSLHRKAPTIETAWIRTGPAEHDNAKPASEAVMRALAEQLSQDFPAANVKWVKVEAPVLYDGLTARECWHRWADNAHWIEQRGPQALHAMTPAQIAAAKVENVVAMKAWPERLRAMIAASAEAERNQVRCELQCDEEDPW